jgi:hypothetical protein
MRSTCLACLSTIFIACCAVALCQDHQLPTVATITISVFDAFGQQQSGCRVEKFVPHDDGNKMDFKDRFNNLIGKGIPFGMNYDVGVKCSDQGSVGLASISVHRTDQFVVLSAAPPRGDYYTGVSPRLSVLVDPNSTNHSSDQAWVEILGVFTNLREIDRVDPETKAAHFYHYGLIPGRYVVLLFNGGKSSCSKQIDIHGPEARLILSPSEHGCEAKGLNAVFVESN